MHALPTPGFLNCTFMVRIHFFQSLSRFFAMPAVANACSYVSLQNKIGNCAHCPRQMMQVLVLSVHGI